MIETFILYIDLSIIYHVHESLSLSYIFVLLAGLPQLSLILNLVQFHGANVEATNRKGMTPLILASQLGLDVIVEVNLHLIAPS